MSIVSRVARLHTGALLLPFAILATAPGAYAGNGDSLKTFPLWEERVMLELTNRARVAPATDLAGCGSNCSAAELNVACYTPKNPLAWRFELNQSSRFHSAAMAKNHFAAHDTPFIIRSDISSVFPDLCDGSSSCASSGAGTTTAAARVALFGMTIAGENIAGGYPTPLDTFYVGWEYEPAAPTDTCSFNADNGHRFGILTNAGPALGNGYITDPASDAITYYTQDFASNATTIPKIPSGSHFGAQGSTFPGTRQSSSIEFWANWLDAAGPMSAAVVVDNVSHTLALGRGTVTNGAWTVTLGSLDTGCHRYYYSFVDSGSNTVRYPATGTLGVGALGSCADWAPTSHFDFNLDTRSDILLRNGVTGDIAQWQMNGTTISSGLVVGNPGVNYSVRTINDFNGDGKADIVLQNSSTNDVAVWLMNGNTLASGVLAGNPGAGWSVAGSGDIDGDGKADIVLQNNGTVAVWFMNGGTITTGAALSGPGAGWSVVGVGDVDGDGRADIVWQQSSTGAVAIWEMHSTTIAAAQVIAAPGAAWVVQGVGDVDGDGKADLLLRNSSSGDIAIWRMNGLMLAAGVNLGSPGGTYNLSGSGDFDGNGKYDVLLRDGSGNIAVWLLNGTSIASGAVVGTPGSNYTAVAK